MDFDATQPKPARTHRGLTVDDLPMKRACVRRMTFPLFKRGLWPPKAWRVPPDLEGPALKMLLEERCAGFNGADKRKTRRPE